LRRQRTAVDFLLIWLLVVVLSGLALFGAWQFWHTDRIYTGITVQGVPVGGMTRSAAAAKLSRSLNPYPAPPVSIVHGERAWALSSSQLAPQADFMAAVNDAYLIGRRGGVPDQIVGQLGALIGFYDVTPPVTYDVAGIHYQISQIAADVRRPGRAALSLGDGLIPAQSGMDVDVTSTAQAILESLERNSRQAIPLHVIETAPPNASPVNTLPGNLPTTFTQPVTLRHEASGLQFALDPATLRSLQGGGGDAPLSEARLRAVVQTWAEELAIPAQDARLWFNANTNQVEVRQPSVAGRALDVESTIALIQAGLSTGNYRLSLPVQSVAPVVDSNRIPEMGIKELVASGTSYFAGSSLARIRNIEVATEKFEGVVIPPNGIFSFNTIVQDVSAANGFEDSLIIWGDRTAVGVGGGVCQVSTTVFRAAMNAGFPIVERYNHGYVVSWYGEPGMDATIYTPTVDFRFRNDTDAYLLIQPLVNSATGVNTFLFYGTKPDRQVTISDPIISDIQQPGEPVYREDPSISPGQRRQVEFAQQGMTVMVERTVTENGQTRTDRIRSVYQPWNAVYLVAPGEAPLPTESAGG
jgi:vancomycin resistance protein YoaR